MNEGTLDGASQEGLPILVLVRSRPSRILEFFEIQCFTHLYLERMALHMLLQMRLLLEAHPALFARTADLFARTSISTFPVTPQSIHLILVVLKHVGAEQALLGPDHVAEPALVAPYIPQRRRCGRPAAALCAFPHLSLTRIAEGAAGSAGSPAAAVERGSRRAGEKPSTRESMCLLF